MCQCRWLKVRLSELEQLPEVEKCEEISNLLDRKHAFEKTFGLGSSRHQSSVGKANTMLAAEKPRGSLMLANGKMLPLTGPR